MSGFEVDFWCGADECEEPDKYQTREGNREKENGHRNAEKDASFRTDGGNGLSGRQRCGEPFLFDDKRDRFLAQEAILLFQLGHSRHRGVFGISIVRHENLRTFRLMGGGALYRSARPVASVIEQVTFVTRFITLSSWVCVELCASVRPEWFSKKRGWFRDRVAHVRSKSAATKRPHRSTREAERSYCFLGEWESRWRWR